MTKRAAVCICCGLFVVSFTVSFPEVAGALPAQAQGRRGPVRRLGRQGCALHLVLQRVQRAAAVPGRRSGLHDRHAGRARGDHPPRRQDDQCGQRSDRGEDLGDLRRKAYGAGLYAMAGPAFEPLLLHRAAERIDRGDGPPGGDQRGLLQPAAGDRGRRRTRAAHRAACARSTRRTSTSCTSPPSSSSTP